MSPKAHDNVSTRERRGRLRHRDTGRPREGRRDWTRPRDTKDSWPPPDARRAVWRHRAVSPAEPPERTSASDTLALDFRPSEL